MNQPKFVVGDRVRFRPGRTLNRHGQTGTIEALERYKTRKWNYATRRDDLVKKIVYKVRMGDGKLISQQASAMDLGDGKWPGFCQSCGAPLFPIDCEDCLTCGSKDRPNA